MGRKKHDLEELYKKYLELKDEYKWGHKKGKPCNENRVNVFANQTGLSKNEAKRILSRFPFGKKTYNSVNDVEVLEISSESGTYGIHTFGYYLKNCKDYCYIVSPFLSDKDISYWKRETPKNNDLKIITTPDNIKNKYSFVRTMDNHSKLFLTEMVAYIGSMNFSQVGMSPKVSVELLVKFKDKRVIDDLKKRFLHWWNDAKPL